MRVVTFKTLALSVVFAVSSPVYAIALEGGAVAAPDQYGADVAAQILKKAATRSTPPSLPRSPWP